jgi:hypothetical protein
MPPWDGQIGIAEADHHADTAQIHECAPEVGFGCAGTDREVTVAVHGAVVIVAGVARVPAVKPVIPPGGETGINGLLGMGQGAMALI